METPYITRSIQPPPNKGGIRPEIFKNGSEQAKRSILDGITKDLESPDTKDNLRVLSVAQNTGALQSKNGKTSGLGDISAPVPGMNKERSLGAMIEDGEIQPSKTMQEMAERHGMELPKKNPNGPDPTRWENSPEMLKLPEPKGELDNPGLRNLTGKMVEQINGPTLEKAEAVQSLDKALSCILNPQEKMAVGLTQPDQQQEEPSLPWLKKPKETEQADPVNPVALFEDAGKKLQKLNEKDQERLLTNYFQYKISKAQEFTKGVERKEEKDKEGPEPSQSTFSKSKKTDVVTSRTTPHMEAFKAGIEFFKEAASNKPFEEKLLGMGKAAAKAVVNLAKTSGAKIAFGVMAAPAVPIAIGAMIIGTAIKMAVDTLTNELNKQNRETPTQEANKEAPNNEKEDIIDRAINIIMPGTGGKKGLAIEGAKAGIEKTAKHLKEDCTQEKAQEETRKQKEHAPNLAME